MGKLRVFAVDVAGVERGDVGFGDLRPLRELRCQPLDRLLAFPAEEPVHQSERPHVLAAVCFLRPEPHVFDGRERRIVGDVEGQGLGAMAGKIWRVGLMGFASNPRNVMTCLTALEAVLSRQGFSLETGAGLSAAKTRLAA